MTIQRASDNPFPSVLFEEHVDPATPPSGHWRLWVDTDNTFKVIDDAGTVTSLGGSGLSDPMTTRGDIIVRNASNVTARLAIGSSGKVLSSDGTDVSWQTPASAGSVVWLQRQTASASATLDFTGFISSTYDVYRFDFVSLICATDNVNLTMRMGTGGGPSYDSSGTYHWQNLQGQGTTTTSSNANSGTAVQLTPVVDNATSSAWTISGSILMFNPMSSTINKFVQGQFTSLFNTGPAFAQNLVAGSYSQTTAVTAVRFLASSGNITSGSIDCYGLKHA